MSYESFFSAKISERNIATKPLKCIIDMQITSVSNKRYSITKSSNRTPVIGPPQDHALINNANRTEWSPIRSVII